MVARVMELVNATRKAIDSGCGPADPAVREATETMAIMLSLVAPYTAEEMWERLGHEPTVSRAGWPGVDPSLLVEESVTCVVQIKGKVRARLEVVARHQRDRPGGGWRWPTRPSYAPSTARPCAR
jgi:leucyl-tRNA synthetase